MCSYFSNLYVYYSNQHCAPAHSIHVHRSEYIYVSRNFGLCHTINSLLILHSLIFPATLPHCFCRGVDVAGLIVVYIHACRLKRGNCLLFWRVGTLVRLRSPQTGIRNLSFVITCCLITEREEGGLLAFLVHANFGLVVFPQTGVTNLSLVITSPPF